MDPQTVLREIREQFAAFLVQHPEERANSTGFVHDHLELRHMVAAVDMHQRHGMRLNAHNLHDVIGHWDHYETLAQMSPDEMVLADFTGTPPGAFNPGQLVAYFMRRNAG